MILSTTTKSTPTTKKSAN